ncbi:bis-aminopropyl spermidine synthase family protein [Geobacillus sp. CAMR5420]|uniref:bis-aminopropyl spermidine synthase family protein n=1 Tax=Geobacillus sp. CAMR5420 TaxID=1482739 RepID=UPI0024100EA9|nr:bis-aminopropyl spermidine synthase family protein [Geobacillus sp. CAMR5420]WJQ05376.1 bis-aminopropyl spermidine synthase family protein [Geobacillus stearothermophilus]WJQ08913.1 bis-aminopropyl spermidine synthase family protein [Geobacillus stearothermophilus]
MRPKATPDFDQGYVTPETTVRRLALMAQQGDLMGRDILLLGDDDLTSIAAALSGLPRRICVLDVDERIVRFVRDVAQDQGWDHVHAEVYDVRDELPSHLRGQFDVFFTDPVDTVKGLLLFLSRCTEGGVGPVPRAILDSLTWRPLGGNGGRSSRASLTWALPSLTC